MSEPLGSAPAGEPELPGAGAKEVPQAQNTSSVQSDPKLAQPTHQEVTQNPEKPPNAQNESTGPSDPSSGLVGPPVALPVSMPVPSEISAPTETQDQTLPDAPNVSNAAAPPVETTGDGSIAADTASTVSDPMEADVSTIPETSLTDRNRPLSTMKDMPSQRKFLDGRRIGSKLYSTSSFVTSIASDIKKGRLENGRVYANYGNHGRYSRLRKYVTDEGRIWNPG